MAEGVGPPHLADATDLERWADQRSAQADLPRLVRRLIRHENDQVQRVEMRGGEGVGLPGYDGIVEATRATSFVPDGIQLPWAVGSALASVNGEHDYQALSLLGSEDARLVRFADGFARARGGGAIAAIRPWVERFVGRPLVQARLLQTVADVTAHGS